MKGRLSISVRAGLLFKAEVRCQETFGERNDVHDSKRSVSLEVGLGSEKSLDAGKRSDLLLTGD